MNENRRIVWVTHSKRVIYPKLVFSNNQTQKRPREHGSIFLFSPSPTKYLCASDENHIFFGSTWPRTQMGSWFWLGYWRQSKSSFIMYFKMVEVGKEKINEVQNIGEKMLV